MPSSHKHSFNLYAKTVNSNNSVSSSKSIIKFPSDSTVVIFLDNPTLFNDLPITPLTVFP